jgi:hypothetical protein
VLPPIATPLFLRKVNKFITTLFEKAMFPLLLSPFTNHHLSFAAAAVSVAGENAELRRRLSLLEENVSSCNTDSLCLVAGLELMGQRTFRWVYSG